MEFKMNKIKIFAGIFLSVLLLSLISAQISYCCEKVKDTGAWCQNMDSKDKCDPAYSAPVATSCESTSYCKAGCCINSNDGTCSQNTAKKTCDNSKGTWIENAQCDTEQCKAGCCILGNTAFFDTLTRCKSYSTLYGVEFNFRNDIQNELQCLTIPNLDVKGACVFSQNSTKTCKITTRKECNDMSRTNQDVLFYEGYLCSAEKLGTNCAKTRKTTCVDGKHEVYFVDSCGNVANIYDSNKVDDTNYWTIIIDKEESCGNGNSNRDSSTCGNCDYYLGSTCKPYQRGQDNTPKYGDNICRDLSCTYNGVRYQHGETWCATNTQIAKKDTPGSQYFRLNCYNGEVDYELCDINRQKICVESTINEFKNAQCIVNLWQDCNAQDNKDDCENKDQRDCKWIKTTTSGNMKLLTEYCVPNYSPGFDFWNNQGTCNNIGTDGKITCIVKYETSVLGGKDCVENCDCMNDAWRKKMAQVCTSVGDCQLEVKGGDNESSKITP